MQREDDREHVHCECMEECVDDVLEPCKYPKLIVEALIIKHKFKLEGTVPISYLLSCKFLLDSSIEL